jgi:hypothetical protein
LLIKSVHRIIIPDQPRTADPRTLVETLWQIFKNYR